MDLIHRPLYRKHHEIELQEKLSQWLQKPVTLKINFKNIRQPGQLEQGEQEQTPAQRLQTLRQATNEKVAEAIRQDPHVQTWVKEFQGQIKPAEPLNPLESLKKDTTHPSKVPEE